MSKGARGKHKYTVPFHSYELQFAAQSRRLSKGTKGVYRL